MRYEQDHSVLIIDLDAEIIEDCTMRQTLQILAPRMIRVPTYYGILWGEVGTAAFFWVLGTSSYVICKLEVTRSDQNIFLNRTTFDN